MSLSDGKKFLNDIKEDGDHNQYWYSSYTIKQMVDDITATGGRVGFLSTPSIYFSLEDELRKDCFVFDFDKQWESDRGFVFYDFNKPDELPAELLRSFDMLVIDPPFITHEVWRKYGDTAKLLLKAGPTEDNASKVICTTVIENADLLKELFGVTPTAFLPCFPTLVYQYNLFTNYPSDIFAKLNPEIPQ
jgi:hypothetical protein